MSAQKCSCKIYFQSEIMEISQPEVQHEVLEV